MKRIVLCRTKKNINQKLCSLEKKFGGDSKLFEKPGNSPYIPWESSLGTGNRVSLNGDIFPFLLTFPGNKNTPGTSIQ